VIHLLQDLRLVIHGGVQKSVDHIELLAIDHQVEVVGMSLDHLEELHIELGKLDIALELRRHDIFKLVQLKHPFRHHLGAVQYVTDILIWRDLKLIAVLINVIGELQWAPEGLSSRGELGFGYIGLSLAFFHDFVAVVFWRRNQLA
jgi:hypothetical protein